MPFHFGFLFCTKNEWILNPQAPDSLHLSAILPTGLSGCLCRVFAGKPRCFAGRARGPRRSSADRAEPGWGRSGRRHLPAISRQRHPSPEAESQGV